MSEYCSTGPAMEYPGGMPTNPADTLRQGPIKVVTYSETPPAKPFVNTHEPYFNQGATPFEESDQKFYKR